tara:strand:- start:353 stop:529 length:177 start_codon:yes stop_codon:yes gene_type:complete
MMVQGFHPWFWLRLANHGIPVAQGKGGIEASAYSLRALCWSQLVDLFILVMPLVVVAT